MYWFFHVMEVNLRKQETGLDSLQGLVKEVGFLLIKKLFTLELQKIWVTGINKRGKNYKNFEVLVNILQGFELGGQFLRLRNISWPHCCIW